MLLVMQMGDKCVSGVGIFWKYVMGRNKKFGGIYYCVRAVLNKNVLRSCEYVMLLVMQMGDKCVSGVGIFWKYVMGRNKKFGGIYYCVRAVLNKNVLRSCEYVMLLVMQMGDKCVSGVGIFWKYVMGRNKKFGGIYYCVRAVLNKNVLRRMRICNVVGYADGG
ncbi:hypothetical protein J6590_064698 [Homalodisca vitripennis]|nr:hypothetical protein J6590_064698 [Homalodisca vitripennis]